MHSAVRALGNLLRLAGISSPEDTERHPAKPATPASRRSTTPPAPSPLRPPCMLRIAA